MEKINKWKLLKGREENTGSFWQVLSILSLEHLTSGRGENPYSKLTLNNCLNLIIDPFFLIECTRTKFLKEKILYNSIDESK